MHPTINTDQHRISSVVNKDLPWIEVTVCNPILMQIVDPYQETSRDKLGVNLAQNSSVINTNSSINKIQLCLVNSKSLGLKVSFRILNCSLYM